MKLPLRIFIFLLLSLSCAYAQSGSSLIRNLAPTHTIQTLHYTRYGSGFYVNAEGYILTDRHVVEHCNSIVITGPSEKRSAQLIALDEHYDLALLKTSSGNVTALYLAQEPARSGQPVTVQAYQGDTKKAVAVLRHATVLDVADPTGNAQYLQVGNIASAGDSGAPIINMQNQVIGIITSRATFTKNGNDMQTIIAIALPAIETFLHDNDIAFNSARQPANTEALTASFVRVECGLN